MEGKSPLRSKTLWVNGLIIVATVGAELLELSLPIPHLATVVALANMLLRVWTRQPLAKKE